MTYDRAYAEEELGADCSHCPLRVGGRFVPSTGPDTADVAFVGEAPGHQEVHEGVPFIGPSGRLLNTVNNAYGIKREEVFLTNACLCRPADGTNPPKLAIAACRPRLIRELTRVGVESVVALGNSAALSILGVEGVTKLRVGPGRSSPYPELSGVRVIPTIHPAACLRQSDMFPSLVADVGKLVARVEPFVEPEVEILWDKEQAIQFLNYIEKRADETVIDIEVDIDKDTVYDHPNHYDLLCVGICISRHKGYIIPEELCADLDVLLAMKEAFLACILIGQNGKFDLAGLFKHLGPLLLKIDTMLMSYALDERPGVHGLKYHAVEDLGWPQYDEDIKKYVEGPTEPELEHFHGYGRIPRPILYKYCGFDTVATMRYKDVAQAKMDRTNEPPAWWGPDGDASWMHWDYKSLNDLHDHLVESGNELMYLELNGIGFDRDYNAELWDSYQERMDKTKTTINGLLTEIGYQPINPNSPLQVKGVFGFFRINAASTDKDTLNTLKDQMVHRYGDNAYDKPIYVFADEMLKWRREAKIFGTYIKGLRRRVYRGRIYSSYLLHGTTTGRLASRNPNMQNIPREKAIKQQFVPAK